MLFPCGLSQTIGGSQARGLHQGLHYRVGSRFGYQFFLAPNKSLYFPEPSFLVQKKKKKKTNKKTNKQKEKSKKEKNKKAKSKQA